MHNFDPFTSPGGRLPASMCCSSPGGTVPAPVCKGGKPTCEGGGSGGGGGGCSGVAGAKAGGGAASLVVTGRKRSDSRKSRYSSSVLPRPDVASPVGPLQRFTPERLLP